MAELSRDGADIVVTLSTLEKVEGLHEDVRFPASTVTEVDVLDDAFDAVRGLWHDIKYAGSYLPDVIAAGTFRNSEGRGEVLAFVHRSARRGLQLRLSDGPYGRVVIGLADPEAVKAELLGG